MSSKESIEYLRGKLELLHIEQCKMQSDIIDVTNQIIKALTTKTDPPNEIRSFDHKDIRPGDRVFVTNSKVKLEKYGVVTKVDAHPVFGKKAFFTFDATKCRTWRALENVVRVEHS